VSRRPLSRLLGRRTAPWHTLGRRLRRTPPGPLPRVRVRARGRPPEALRDLDPSDPARAALLTAAEALISAAQRDSRP
jgi:hypothetical protein